jgi:5'-nucleotidase
MRILLCNDDGYQAPGLAALHTALAQLPGVVVEVLAPEHNNSAKSNALTLHTPLYVKEGANGFRYVNGTPADCIHIALTGLLDYRPDMVVSGINNGANLGDDTIYSGTVGAAIEAYLFGIPAVAFSQTQKGWAHLDVAAQAAQKMVQQLQGTLPQAQPWLLNVNIPNHEAALPHAWKLCRLGRRHAAEPVVTQTNPQGETMYWIGSAGKVKDGSAGTDFHAIAQGNISITPLHVDLTKTLDFPLWETWAAASRLS